MALGRRRNRLFVLLIILTFSVSFLGLWMCHHALLDIHEDHHLIHHGSLRKRAKFIKPRTSWKRVLSEWNNRTIHAACNQTTATLVHGWNSKDTIHSISEHCNYPPPQECDATDYSIVVVWSASNNTTLRTLFVNLLQALTLPHVLDIQVWLFDYDNAMEAFHSNAKYGRRILSWHDNAKHKLVVMNASNTTDRPTLLSRAAVVLLDGTVSLSLSRHNMQLGQNVWKRNSDSIVASDVVRIRTSSMKNPDKKIASTNAMCSNNSLSLVSVDDNHDVDPSKTIQIPYFSGMWIHVDFLCAWYHMNHGDSLQALEWELVVWLMHVTASRPIHVYPTVKGSPHTIQELPSSTEILDWVTRDEFGGMLTASRVVEWCADDNKTNRPFPCSRPTTTLAIINECI